MSRFITEALPIGTQLQGGKYIIREAIGQGATGITYLASMAQRVEGELGSMEAYVNVALKEFYMKNECQRGETTSNVVVPNTKNNLQVSQYKESFIKEAKKIAKLSHPNIVHVVEVFDENDTVYYVMQFIGGGSIKEAIEKYGALSEQDALKYTRQIASALDYMHTQKNMCHYDLKPGNIMLSERGDAMLIDFGIAKNYDSQGNETSTTPPGLTKGFAPLEQYSSISDFSPKSDVYSLGATLYAMLTATTPPEPMEWLNNKPFTPKPDRVSQRTWDIVRRAMSLTTEARPTMAELIEIIDGKRPVNETVKPEETQYGGTGEETLTFDQLKARQEAARQRQQPVAGGTPYVQDDPAPAKRKSSALIVLLIVVVVAIAAGVSVYFALNGKTEDKPATTEVQADTITDKPIYDSTGKVIMRFKGEVKNGMPVGRGVVTYINDADGRVRYEGAYLNGMREDSAAVLTYVNGDVYRGSFIADRLGTGTYTVQETGEYFRGTFKNDQPYNGVWYDKSGTELARVVKGK